MKRIICKPSIKRSKFRMVFQRAASWCECGNTVLYRMGLRGWLETFQGVDANGNLIRYHRGAHDGA